MGTIIDQINTAFRDFVTDGVASSGAHDVIKSEVRAVGPIIETAIGNAALGALVSVVYSTKAGIDADLAHAADTIALVYADSTDANNDLYIKVGASGAGSWTLTSILHDAIDGAASSYVTAAEAAQAAAEAAQAAAEAAAADAADEVADALASASITSQSLDHTAQGYKLYQAIDIASEASSPLFTISPRTCFVEASVTATTVAGVGDEVGCIKDLTGDWFAVASSTTYRGTLRIDTAGHYYIDCNNASVPANQALYLVKDVDSNAFSPTTSFSHVGGWQAGASARFFAWVHESADGSLRSTSVANSKTSIALPNSAGTYETLDILPVVTLPFVLAYDVNGTTNHSVHVNENIYTSPTTNLYDFSSDTLALAICGNDRAAGGKEGHMPDGAWYGGAWIAGGATTEQIKILKDFFHDLTVFSDWGIQPNDSQPVITDFENSVFEWCGENKVLADLTDEGSGVYTLPCTTWFNQEFSIVVEAEIDNPDDALEIIKLNNDVSSFIDTYETVIKTGTQEGRIDVTPSGLGRTVVEQQIGVQNPTSKGKRQRYVVIFRPKKLVEGWANHYKTIASSCHSWPTLPPSSVTISTAHTGFSVKRVEFYGKALEGAELYAALKNEEYAPTVHCHGDSFVTWGDYDFEAQIFENAASEYSQALLTSSDGVGGMRPYEPNGQGHATRLQHSPEHHDSIIVYNDGGIGYDEAFPEWQTGSLMRMFDLLHRDGDTSERRFLFMQGNPINNLVGTSGRDEWDEGDAKFKEIAGDDNFIETLEIMFAMNDGSTQDVTDVGNGKWPDSATSDDTHYESPGRLAYARAFLARICDFGWISGSTAVPGAPQNLTETAGVLTWDAPSSDGGHPVQGYEIKKDGVTQTAQGSPTGFTKQYIREFTTDGAATYTVAAITHKGTGSTASVVVS